MGRPFEVEPIRREGASQRVVNRLLALVTAGNLRPGDRLPGERELSESFGVSRPTIREAVRALAVLGVLRTVQGGGIYVSELRAADLLGPLTFFLRLDDSDVDQLYAARRLIEGEIGALAAARVTADDLAALAALIAEQAAAVDDPAAYRLLDTAFHGRIARIAGNPFLARAAESLNVLGQEVRRIASESPQVIAASIADHRRILAALAAGDAEGARAAMGDHMIQVLATSKRGGGAQP